ncbi:unnamed protein product, partial [Ectocarpus fasciculatus]
GCVASEDGGLESSCVPSRTHSFVRDLSAVCTREEPERERCCLCVWCFIRLAVHIWGGRVSYPPVGAPARGTCSTNSRGGLVPQSLLACWFSSLSLGVVDTVTVLIWAPTPAVG